MFIKERKIQETTVSVNNCKEKQNVSNFPCKQWDFFYTYNPESQNQFYTQIYDKQHVS